MKNQNNINTGVNYITPEGIEKLKEELHQLLHIERPKIVDIVAWAASNGDRSENADYLYGKKRLREIDKKVMFLSKRIESAEVVDPKSIKSNKVLFGAKVTIADEMGIEKTYKIVGEDEFDIKQSKISWKSPMARALLGREVGDQVVVKKPSGEELVTVEFIAYE